MKNLFLLRHCEAYHFEENKSDHEKQLNENGRKCARLLKNWFEKNNIVLDYILTSSANRTLTTANIIFSNYENKIYQKKELYLCDYKEIFKELKILDNNFNPGFKTKLHAKDLRIVKNLANKKNLKLPGTNLVNKNMKKCNQDGHSEKDSSSYYYIVKKQNKFFREN